MKVLKSSSNIFPFLSAPSVQIILHHYILQEYETYFVGAEVGQSLCVHPCFKCTSCTKCMYPAPAPSALLLLWSVKKSVSTGTNRGLQLHSQTSRTVNLQSLQEEGKDYAGNISALFLCLMNMMEYLMPVRIGKDLDIWIAYHKKTAVYSPEEKVLVSGRWTVTVLSNF